MPMTGVLLRKMGLAGPPNKLSKGRANTCPTWSTSKRSSCDPGPMPNANSVGTPIDAGGPGGGVRGGRRGGGRRGGGGGRGGGGSTVTVRYVVVLLISLAVARSV